MDQDSPGYRFMGFIKTFEKAGFNFVKKAGTRRNLMVYKFNENKLTEVQTIKKSPDRYRKH
jgi:hypothetical protein